MSNPGVAHKLAEYAASAVALEREECAKLIETVEIVNGDQYGTYMIISADAPVLAKLIRARGERKAGENG